MAIPQSSSITGTSPSDLLRGGGLTPQQKCSRCILQPQLTGQHVFIIAFFCIIVDRYNKFLIKCGRKNKDIWRLVSKWRKSYNSSIMCTRKLCHYENLKSVAVNLKCKNLLKNQFLFSLYTQIITKTCFGIHIHWLLYSDIFWFTYNQTFSCHCTNSQ